MNNLPDFEGGTQPKDRPAPTYEEFLALDHGNEDLPDHESLGRLRWHGAAAWRGVCRAGADIQKSVSPESKTSLVTASRRLKIIDAMVESGKVFAASCGGEASDIISDVLNEAHILHDSIVKYILKVQISTMPGSDSPELPKFEKYFPAERLAEFRALLDKLPHPPGKA